MRFWLLSLCALALFTGCEITVPNNPPQTIVVPQPQPYPRPVVVPVPYPYRPCPPNHPCPPPKPCPGPYCPPHHG